MAYTKTKWVNDKTPAINATNLNNIENGIEEAHNSIGNLSLLNTENKDNLVNAINEINTNLLQIGLSEDYNYTTGSEVTLPFSKTTQQIGNIFTLVGNKIVVGGNNVSGKCRFVCNLFGFNPSSAVNSCYAFLYKNDTKTVAVFSTGAGNHSRFSLLMDVILDYQSGDKFELKIGGTANFQLPASYYENVMYIQSITTKGE